MGVHRGPGLSLALKSRAKKRRRARLLIPEGLRPLPFLQFRIPQAAEAGLGCLGRLGWAHARAKETPSLLGTRANWGLTFGTFLIREVVASVLRSG